MKKLKSLCPYDKDVICAYLEDKPIDGISRTYHCGDCPHYMPKEDTRQNIHAFGEFLVFAFFVCIVCALIIIAVLFYVRAKEKSQPKHIAYYEAIR